ncbi:MAG: cell division protein CrgA [Micrococcus sp.]|nr:cell division protein CrgA [Micrococcus sp.]
MAKKAKKATTQQNALEGFDQQQATPLPRWYKVLMFGLMIVGLLWVCVYYLTQAQYPIPALGGWNIITGFGLAMLGFLMMSRWSE